MLSALGLLRLLILAGALLAFMARGVWRNADALQAGLAALRRQRRPWLVFSHLAVVPVLAFYLGMVAANTFGFGYSFWNEPAPTAAADAFAVASVWGFAAVAGFVGAATYGWMCRRAVEPDDAPLGRQLLASLRAFGPRAPLALPAFAATVVAWPFVLPSVLLVTLFGAAPFRRLATPPMSFSAYRGFLDDRGSALSSVALVFSLAAIVADALVIAAVSITDNHDGPVELVTVVLVWMTFVTAALAAGWAASAFAHVWAGRGSR